MTSLKRNIVFFDGHCNLCNSFVDVLLKQDKKKTLHFASLQGETAKECLAVNSEAVDFDSVIYLRGLDIARDVDVTGPETYTRSTAVLKILTDVGGVWSLARLFFLVPTPLRDFVYKLVARNRIRWFGRRDTCRMPTEDEKNQLLP